MPLGTIMPQGQGLAEILARAMATLGGQQQQPQQPVAPAMNFGAQPGPMQPQAIPNVAPDPYAQMQQNVEAAMQKARDEKLQQMHSLGLFPETEHPFKDHPFRSTAGLLARLAGGFNERYNGQTDPYMAQLRQVQQPGYESSLGAIAMRPYMDQAAMQHNMMLAQLEQQRAAGEAAKIPSEVAKNEAATGLYRARTESEQGKVQLNKEANDLKQASLTARSKEQWASIAQRARASAANAKVMGEDPTELEAIAEAAEQAAGIARGGQPKAGGKPVVKWGDLP